MECRFNSWAIYPKSIDACNTIECSQNFIPQIRNVGEVPTFFTNRSKSSARAIANATEQKSEFCNLFVSRSSRFVFCNQIQVEGLSRVVRIPLKTPIIGPMW